MLKSIAADEVELTSRALAVRYRDDPGRQDWVVVNITARQTDGDSNYIRRVEINFVVIDEEMTRDAMQARVEIEAERRDIDCVAWIAEHAQAQAQQSLA